MNSQFMVKNLRILTFQRNIFLLLTVSSSITLLILSFFVFMKNERIIITPPIIEKEFWVEGNRISPTYLEQFGVFIGQLLFNKSAQSAASQRAILLRHTHSSYISVLRQKLVEEEEMLKKQNASYVFYPEKIDVKPDKMQVVLSGERLTFASGKQVSAQQECYILSFDNFGSQLRLNNVSMTGEKQ